MRFLFLEPFFGGSHRDFAEGLVAHSCHEIDLVTLPARFWKWRTRGAALHFIKNSPPLCDFNGLILSDLMSLSDFRCLAGTGCPPALVYFHENQITYPVAPGESRDVQFGFTDITTALAAHRILFNSRTHCDAFFHALPAFIGQMPEYKPHWVTGVIRNKAAVLYPGCQFSGEPAPLRKHFKTGAPPLIIWNHRWEFDKNPDAFFDALEAIFRNGIDFRLAILGENFQAVPKVFIKAKERWGDRILQYGHVGSKQAYHDWLKRGTVVVSTANQENFGISTVEAIRFGCFPILPHRLAYPEVIPDRFHSLCLYRSHEDLVTKLGDVLKRPDRYLSARKALSISMADFAWENMISAYDRELKKLADSATGSGHELET